MTDDKPKPTEVAAAVHEAVADKEIRPPLSIKVGMENGKVVTIFSQRLSVFSLPWDEAEKYADALYHHASEAKEASET